MKTNHAITNWNVSNGELQIVVVSSPFSMTKRFVWKHHTTNHYGQGAKWCWWSMYEGKVANNEVHKEAANLLTALVYDHEILSKLVDHFHIPKGVEGAKGN